MFIDKVQPFFAPDELKRLDGYTEKIDAMLDELSDISQKLRAVRIKRNVSIEDTMKTVTSEIYGEDADLVRKCEKRRAILNAQISEADKLRNILVSEVQNRYIESFSGDKDLILADVSAIVTAYEKEEFIALQKDRKKNLKLFGKAKDLKTVEKKVYKQYKKNAEENFENCYAALLWRIRIQLKALERWDFPNDEALQIAEDKAACFYDKPEEFLADSTYESLAENQLPEYPYIRQGVGTNTFTKIGTVSKEDDRIDEITGKLVIQNGDFMATVLDYKKLSGGLKTSTYQLFDAIVLCFTENGSKSHIVELPLKEYMARRGLKNRKEARKQAENDLETLYNASLSFKKHRKKVKGQKEQDAPDFQDVRIIDSKGINNGIINVSFSRMFYKILLSYPVMPYPIQLLQLKSKDNPNSYYLLRKIAEHKNMNAGKKNENIISVKTLLSAAPFIPTYEKVMSSDRHLQTRIMDPFDRDMDALNGILGWYFCHSLDEKLTEDELYNMDYETFKNLMVRIEWHDYPDQTARLERRLRKTEQAKKKSSDKYK